jgi:hypothetical protein
MEHLKHLIPLREYCKQNKWPRLPQWQHWIYSRNGIAQACIKKVGKRYLIDTKAFDEFLKKASLDETT